MSLECKGAHFTNRWQIFLAGSEWWEGDRNKGRLLTRLLTLNGRCASGGHLLGPNLLQKYSTRHNHLMIKVSLFELADCDICVAARVRSWMGAARGLEGRQLKWMRRKTGLRFFEPAPGTWASHQARLPAWSPGADTSLSCHLSSLGGLFTYQRAPPSHWSVNFPIKSEVLPETFAFPNVFPPF